MKKMKRLATMLVAGLMASVMAFPSLARTYEYKTGSTEIKTDEYGQWASGHVRQYPSWVWVNGYCYYYQNRHLPEVLGNNYLKNCVTPDGYTVDAEGRWTENGVPQHNSYGSEVIGTDELYAGKNDDERWQIMRELATNLFLNNIEGTEYAVAMMSTLGGVYGYWTQEGYAHYGLLHNSANGNYLTVSFNNAWNDCPEEYILNKNETIEKLIKITCGDHVGQELFDDIRKAADPAGSAGNIIELDENGNLIWIDADHVKIKTIEHASNGVDFSLFDLNKWNGRQTDYGKTITIVPAEERHQWEIIIN